jgi:kinesin family protein 15
MLDLINRGVSNRHVGSTSMNEHSSRSHSVLTAHIESKVQKDGLWNIRMSRFHIIDLAGSERAKAANTAGERLKEAGMINKSLSTLGNVINSCVEVSEGRARHIHYRDSKLTFLLRDSLGGNSKTLIIANVSPSSSSFGETLSTLKFAQRAKLIKNKAIINEDSAGTVAILKEEIKRLKILLAKQDNEPDASSELHQLCVRTLEKIDSVEEDELEDSEFTPETGSTSLLTKKRILFLEKLLQLQLQKSDDLREYFTKDVEDKDQIIKKLQYSVESFEKGRKRDKMVIKFRDATIKKFGDLSEKLNDEESKHELEQRIQEINSLRQEIESNPKTAKIFVENDLLKKERDELKKNISQTKDSLYSQYRSAIEFVQELNNYIKGYIEKEEMDRDEIIRTQVDIERASLKIEHEEDSSRLEE